MYATKNYPTKKALKDAVARGEHVGVYQPGPFAGDVARREGYAGVEGPHYPEPHRWYARVLLQDGRIVKVVS